MKRTLFWKRLVICVVLLSLLQFAIPSALSLTDEHKHMKLSNTWIVDDEGDGDFTTIQDAIDASVEGDTIEVYSGTYVENVWLNKNNLEVIGIAEEYGSGGDSGKPIIDGSELDAVVEMKLEINEPIEDVDFSGFNIQNGGTGNSGISIYHASDIKIFDCNITLNSIGIRVNTVDTLSIYNNCIFDNTDGIYMDNSDENNIFENTLDSNSEYGIWLEGTVSSKLSQNLITNCGTGIYFRRASGNEVISNDFVTNEKHADFLNCFNYWRYNSWDDNKPPKNIYVVWGGFKPFAGVPWLVIPIFQIDWNAD